MLRTKVLTIPAMHKGALIGKGGEAISAIRNASAAEIHIKHTEGESLVTVTICGSNIELAEKLIGERLANSGRSVEAGWESKIVDVPQEFIGPTIGNGGCNLREMQERTGCRFKFIQASEVDPSAAAGKQVACIRGPPDKINAGEKALLEKVAEVQQQHAKRQFRFGKGGKDFGKDFGGKDFGGKDFGGRDFGRDFYGGGAAAYGGGATAYGVGAAAGTQVGGGCGGAPGTGGCGAGCAGTGCAGEAGDAGMAGGTAGEGKGCIGVWDGTEDPGASGKGMCGKGMAGKAVGCMGGKGMCGGPAGKGMGGMPGKSMKGMPGKGVDMPGMGWEGAEVNAFHSWDGMDLNNLNNLNNLNTAGWGGMDMTNTTWDGKSGMDASANWWSSMWNDWNWWWGGWHKKRPPIPCKFQMRGYCKNGEKCTFSHDPEVIAAALGEGASSSMDGLWDPGYKMTYCKYWDSGKCTRGATCTFAHGIDDLRGGLTPENVSLMEQAQQMMQSSLKSDEVEQRLTVMNSAALQCGMMNSNGTAALYPGMNGNGTTSPMWTA